MKCHYENRQGFASPYDSSWEDASFELHRPGQLGFTHRRLLQSDTTKKERGPFVLSGATSTVFLVLAACLTCLIIASLFFSYFCLRLRSSRRRLSAAETTELAGHTSSTSDAPVTPIPLIEINPLHAMAAKGELACPPGSVRPSLHTQSRIVVVHPDDQVVIACHRSEEEEGDKEGGGAASRRASQELRGSCPFQGGPSSRRSSFEEYLVQPYQNHLML